MAVTVRPFGVTKDGESVAEYMLTNESDLTVCLIDYGARITKIIVPDKSGAAADVALGYDTVEGYEGDRGSYFGATIGRFANRIARGKFTLNGREYRLALNNGANHLHGGPGGFDSRVWSAKTVADGVQFSRVSPDGEEGYPGSLTVYVTYRLAGRSLAIEYAAMSDADTIVNLTNHVFINLNGHGVGTVYNHRLMIDAIAYLPIDGTSIPLGAPVPVAGTPFDFFSVAAAIGDHIELNDPQLAAGGGFDHNYVLDGDEYFKRAAVVESPDTGIRMTVSTTEPGVQFYSANFLTGQTGKGGAVYRKRGALCLETQHYPDAVNQPSYPTVILRAGEMFMSSTVMSFSLSDE
ncbi:MAG: galactose mutarotase [Clostridiales bacterium]|jgi:aldose 1-epimerase|nr:galactose mutarotase [Clostridiales bacterium]